MTWLISKRMLEYCESLRSLPGQGGESSGGNCLGGKPSAPLNASGMPPTFLHNGKTMAFSTLSRFGLTCELLTDDLGKDLLTLFREAFPVKTLAVRGVVPELLEAEAGCGQSSPGLLLEFNPAIVSSRTALYLSPEAWKSSYKTLPKWGSMRSGVVSAQERSDCLITAKGSGSLLPTPSGVRSGKNHVAGRLDEWGGSSNLWRGTSIGKTHSPAFEEWVMGWPEQWTALTEYETGKFQQWLQQHGTS